MDVPPSVYDADPYWRTKRLTPAQLRVRDVVVADWKYGKTTMLEMKRVSEFNYDTDILAAEDSSVQIDEDSKHINADWERTRLEHFQQDYGWMKHLRVRDGDSRFRCRWIHISSNVPSHLQGALLALSEDQGVAIRSLRTVELCFSQNERFSKHGRHFSPFFKSLDPENDDSGNPVPLLVSVPFLDWTVSPGPPPASRFQVDRQEPYHSVQSATHPIRSLLQYYYRLEDTADREKSQVYSKHRPWDNDNLLNKKVLHWYGNHPTGLNVDELWVLVIDWQHIVTFSSNQSWKPAMSLHQIPHRIAQLSFRGLRNRFYLSGNRESYNAVLQLVASLSGAVGLLHRSFWPDVVLCMADRFGGYLNHLQYRLHRSPSTKLVMELLQIQDELNIVMQIIHQQRALFVALQEYLEECKLHYLDGQQLSTDAIRSAAFETANMQYQEPLNPTMKQHSSSLLSNPFSQLLENLDREACDLQELRENAGTLVNRTVQLVNLRVEDHGKAILVFTTVTILFLPLNFVTSFFGMNTSDIRNMSRSQSIFWAAALSLTTVIVGVTTFAAFYGGALIERFIEFKDDRRRQRLRPRILPKTKEKKSFRVLGTLQQGGETGF